MSIVRVKKDPGDFFLMAKEPVEDSCLSWKAKGMLAYFMSKPNDWQIWVKDLTKRSTDGRDAVLSGLNELIDQGYATREQPRRKDGTLGPVEYIVYESPQTGFPYTDKPCTDKPLMEKPTHTNNDCTNNNQNKNEGKDFLSKTAKSDRERIRDILVDVLADGEMPGTDYLLRPFADAVDALVIEFRKIEGKSRLDDDLTSKIIGAIRAAYEDENNWQFNKTTSPTRAVIACIVAQGRANKDKAQARSEFAEAAAHSQQALAERQAERQPPTDQEVWWGQVLGELKLQMTTPTFNTWLKDTVLLERANGRVVVGVANAYALDWLENRLKGMVERTLGGFGVSEVEFEVMPSGGEP